MRQRCRLLDLGNQPCPVTDKSSSLEHVSRRLHKRERDEVDAKVQTEGKVLSIFLRQRRQRQQRPWQVDTLAAFKPSPDFDNRVHIGLTNILDGHTEPAIIEQQPLARGNCRENLGMRQLNRGPIAAQRKADSGTCNQFNAVIRQTSHTNFGSLQILQYGNRALELLLQTSDCSKHSCMLRMFAVAEIQPEDIRTAKKELSQHGFR